MASKVNIINIGLVNLRAEIIALPIEDTVVGRKTNAVYDIHLKSMLRAHPWNFAKKETALSLLTTTPILDDDYGYIYSLPSDFIRLTKTDLQDTYSHKIKGKRIYSNSDELKIEYIYFNEDPNSYDDSFIEAFAAKLAAELCYAITGDKELVKIKWTEFKEKLNIARSVNGQETTPDTPLADTYLNARL